MKLYYLIIGLLLFIIGAYIKTKWIIAAGIIFVILSLSGRKENSDGKEKDEEKKKSEHKVLTSKSVCPDCGTEVLSDDNYCPDCGKKILP